MAQSHPRTTASNNSFMSLHRIPGPPPSIYYLPSFITPAEEASLLNSTHSVPLPQWRQLSHRRLQSHPSPLSAQNVLLDAPLPPWLQWPADRITGLSIPACPSESDSRGRDSSNQGSDDVKRQSLFEGSPHGSPNHCLVNEYRPGQGIMPHEDGPAYWPVTATVSLGGQAVLVVRKKGGHGRSDAETSDGDGDEPGLEPEVIRDPGEQTAWRILCEPRSLLITTGDAYVHTLHSIEGIEVDEGVVDPETVGVGSDGSKGIANWALLGDREGWVQDDGRRARETRVSLTYRDVMKVKSLKAFGALKGLRKR